jgi:hypothetical protein
VRVPYMPLSSRALENTGVTVLGSPSRVCSFCSFYMCLVKSHHVTYP